MRCSHSQRNGPFSRVRDSWRATGLGPKYGFRTKRPSTVSWIAVRAFSLSPQARQRLSSPTPDRLFRACGQARRHHVPVLDNLAVHHPEQIRQDAEASTRDADGT